MDYINAFWVGGLICALAQILMEKTKMLPGRIMVLIVCLGAVLGAVGTVHGICGSRSKCSVIGIWQCFVEGCQRSSRCQWLFRTVSGRL